MGAEAACTLVVGRARSQGRALLETDALLFRGSGTRLSIPYKTMTAVEASGGVLRVTHAGGSASFEIGAAAPTWADRIRNPRSRADKLGIKAGQRVWICGVKDAALKGEITGRGATLVTRQAPDLDALFYAAETRAALESLASLKRSLAPAGALWVIRPKGSPAISESDVMKAGKAAGLVDVKVVRFSDTHTAEKYVIPVKDRRV